MDKTTESLGASFGILPKLQALDEDILRIEGVESTEYDIRDYPEIRYVILVPKYHIPVSTPDYFNARRRHLQAIFDACAKHGLTPTGDSVEDMGNHWYIVRKCDHTWPHASI